MRPIIRVEGLGKQFRIGARQAPYKTLRESIVSAALVPLKTPAKYHHLAKYRGGCDMG